MSKRRSDYRVGYGKPPPEHQFKPGHSGHRPRAEKLAQTVEELLRRRLSQEIVAQRGGRKEKLTTAEALVEKLVHSALQGNDANLRFLLKATDRIRAAPAEHIAPSGKRTVRFELSEEECQLANAIRDELGEYFVPCPDED